MEGSRQLRGAVAGSIKAQLDEAEFVIRAQMARIAELEAEVARLMAECTAHQTLRSIYSDSNQPAGLRVKAAQAALNVETPRLTPQPPVLDLVGEEIEPLAELVHKRRARQDALEPPHKVVNSQVILLKGNGSDDGDKN